MSLFSAIADLLKPTAPPDPQTAAALDHVIGMVDPLVRAVPRLEKHLLGAVEHALGYCDKLVTALPGPIEINRRSFGTDMLVHTLFATPSDIEDMLGRSQAVRDFLDRPECWASDGFCAMLAARRKQRRQFGMAQQGNMIRSDVPQEVLYFSDQTLIEPCCEIDMTRQRLRAKALESLLRTFNTHVDALRHERDNLRIDLSIEHAQFFAKQRHDASQEDKHTRHLVELDVSLRQNGEALMPENLVEMLADFLYHPESALSLTPVSICIDRMGILHEPGKDDTDAQIIVFPELSSRDRRQHLATLVHISRDEAFEAVNKSRERQKRYIII